MKLPRRIFYKLDEQHRVVPCRDWWEWAKGFEFSERVVAQTYFHPDIAVSTVFLGLDHRGGFGGGPPLVFETMVFGLDASDGDNDMQRRYASWDDAETGHAATVRRVKDLLIKASLATNSLTGET